jgi:Tfp pilus assembly protein PilO
VTRASHVHDSSELIPTDAAIDEVAAEVMKRQVNPYTKYYLMAFLAIFLVLVAGYVYYVNKEMAAAGMLDKKKKPLSKKKLLKEKAKQQQKQKAA